MKIIPIAALAITLATSATAAPNLIAAEAQRQGVPVSFALKIAKVESGYRCNAVGPKTRHGRAQGPLQILPGSARALGWRSGSLTTCGAGLHYGMKHLAMCWRAAGGHQALAAMCHNGGLGALKRRSAGVTQYARKVLSAGR